LWRKSAAGRENLFFNGHIAVNVSHTFFAERRKITPVKAPFAENQQRRVFQEILS
jgi:hypothetical protein